MTLARNKTLKGHKALIITTVPAPREPLDAIRKQFPDLKIVERVVPWGVTEVESGASPEEWKDVTLLLTPTVLPTVQQAPNVQYVQLISAGVNHIVCNPFFSDTDIPFCSANGIHGPPIAEWIITSFLSFQRHFGLYSQDQQEGKWKRNAGNPNISEDSVGKRVGVLGYGSIGRQTARIAKALGMDVYAYTLHPRTTPESRMDYSYTPRGLGDVEGILPSKWFSGKTKDELHAFLGSGLDLLVITTPLTDTTQHLISKPEFDVLSKAGRTYVSNVSRGPIVHTNDLIDALNTGLINGAALDVTDPEPLPDGHPLWAAKNVTITPHISASTRSYYPRLLDLFQMNLQRLSEGRELINEINRKKGY